MIAADRDGPSRRRRDEQDRRRLAPANRVEKVQLQAEQIIGSKRRSENYVERGHGTIVAGASPCTLPKPRAVSDFPSVNTEVQGYPCRRKCETHRGFHIKFMIGSVARFALWNVSRDQVLSVAVSVRRVGIYYRITQRQQEHVQLVVDDMELHSVQTLLSLL